MSAKKLKPLLLILSVVFLLYVGLATWAYWKTLRSFNLVYGQCVSNGPKFYTDFKLALTADQCNAGGGCFIDCGNTQLESSPIKYREFLLRPDLIVQKLIKGYSMAPAVCMPMCLQR